MKANQNIFLSSIKIVLIDFVGDFIFFPIWWYSGGLKKAFLWFVSTIKSFEYRLAVGLWIRNLFVPMFGQTDWQGRLISIFMRIVQIIFRIVLFVVISIFVFVVFLLWILFPIFVVYSILINFRLYVM